MLTSPIIPAVIPSSLTDVQSYATQLIGLPELHLDVVDGSFVPFTSWPYTSSVRPCVAKVDLDQFSLEVDLMVANPLIAATDWIEAGADRLVFHVETLSVEEFQQFVSETNITVSIAANNETTNEQLAAYLSAADSVQVMGIAQIGSQGQPFDERALSRIAWLHARWPNLPISIDGSVNVDTLPRLMKQGLDRYIVGSAIIKQSDPSAAYHDLSKKFSN